MLMGLLYMDIASNSESFSLQHIPVFVVVLYFCLVFAECFSKCNSFDSNVFTFVFHHRSDIIMAAAVTCKNKNRISQIHKMCTHLCTSTQHNLFVN